MKIGALTPDRLFVLLIVNALGDHFPHLRPTIVGHRLVLKVGGSSQPMKSTHYLSTASATYDIKPELRGKIPSDV